MRRIMLPIICAMLLFTSVALSQEEKPQPYEDPDAYRIYSMLLGAIVKQRGLTADSTIFVQSETDGSYKMCLRPKEEYKSVKAAIENYLEVNKKKYVLQQNFTSSSATYKMLSLEDTKPFGEMYTPVAWDAFLKKYPNSGGYIQFSAIGYNPDRTAAIVYLVENCGHLCTSGTYYVLEKKDGRWHAMDWDGVACNWIS